MDSWWGTTATTSIFIAAAVTDWLDGYIARKVFLYVCIIISEGDMWEFGCIKRCVLFSFM